MGRLQEMQITRRRMLAQMASAGAIMSLPSIIPSTVLGKNAPSNRITLAMIGTGRQGIQANLRTLVNIPEVQVVAVCDPDTWRMHKARDMVNEKYQNNDCSTSTDFRKIIARDDIDAVMNSTPDHWHVPISLAAIRAGKHVSCEKPLTLSIAEGRVLADAAKKRGIVFRTDSECRSHAYMHKTGELVRNGYLGAVKRIEVGVPKGDKPGGNPEPMPVPAELHYDMWLGPAPQKEYTVDRVHPRQSLSRPGWMRCSDTCEGMITNWGTHLLDVAQQINDTERTGPVSVEGTGRYPEPGSGLWDVLLSFKAQFRYANGVVLDYFTDVPYLRVEGEDGWIEAHWHSRGGLTAHDKKIFRTKFKETDIRLPQRADKEDFVYCIKHNAPEQSMADAEVGHRTCSIGQLAHIAIKRGIKLAWDPDKERFEDKEANRLLTRTYRQPWDLDMAI
jgi:predicted dehydrogenase